KQQSSPAAPRPLKRSTENGAVCGHPNPALAQQTGTPCDGEAEKARFAGKSGRQWRLLGRQGPPPGSNPVEARAIGNPNGRPKGHRNIRSELLQIASQKIAVRDGDKERHPSLLAANFLAHAIKGAKGDARSSSLVFNLAEKMKVVSPEKSYRIETVNAAAGAAKPRPTDGLFENLDLNLLSRPAMCDGEKTRIYCPQAPGAAGKFEANKMVGELQGYMV